MSGASPKSYLVPFGFIGLENLVSIIFSALNLPATPKSGPRSGQATILKGIQEITR